MQDSMSFFSQGILKEKEKVNKFHRVFREKCLPHIEDTLHLTSCIASALNFQLWKAKWNGY